MGCTARAASASCASSRGAHRGERLVEVGVGQLGAGGAVGQAQVELAADDGELVGRRALGVERLDRRGRRRAGEKHDEELVLVGALLGERVARDGLGQLGRRAQDDGDAQIEIGGDAALDARPDGGGGFCGAEKMTLPLAMKVLTPVAPSSRNISASAFIGKRFLPPTLMPRRSATYVIAGLELVGL